jgi:hypothetical protein
MTIWLIEYRTKPNGQLWLLCGGKWFDSKASADNFVNVLNTQGTIGNEYRAIPFREITARAARAN